MRWEISLWTIQCPNIFLKALNEGKIIIMAGTIDKVGTDFKPFMLMQDVMKLFREKCKS
jgi:hypothetical protein